VVNGATPDLMVVDELHTMDDAKLEVARAEFQLAETKAKVIALDASQRVLEADAFAGKLASMGRRRFRAMVFAKNRGDEKAKAKRVAKARAKSKVAKQSRKRNRS
jgi:hypothetical protein